MQFTSTLQGSMNELGGTQTPLSETNGGLLPTAAHAMRKPSPHQHYGAGSNQIQAQTNPPPPNPQHKTTLSCIKPGKEKATISQLFPAEASCLASCQDPVPLTPFSGSWALPLQNQVTLPGSP